MSVPRIRRAVAGVVASLFGTFSGAVAQDTQETRVLAVVDYLAGSDVYLAAGADHGVREGDTLAVYAGEAADAPALGVLVFRSVTARRSMASMGETAFPLSRGDVVYLGVPASRLVSEEPVEEAREAPVSPSRRAPMPPPGTAPPPSPSPEIHGRVSLELDALKTTTGWEGDPEARTDRQFTTPTARVQFRASDLPGGLILGTNLRVAHRTSSDDLVEPVTSARVYQLDLEKRFDRVPLELHLGRFNNSFEDFSGFWDGLLLRLGSRDVGGGLAVGFEPDRWNEGVSTTRPKASGFFDFTVRREEVRYSGSVALQAVRPTDSLPDRTSVGFSHELRLGGFRVRHRMEADEVPEGGSWRVTRLQVDGSVTLSPGLDAFVGLRRWETFPLWDPAGELGPRRERVQGGVSFFGSAGSGSLGLALDRPEEGDAGRTLTASLHLPTSRSLGVGAGGFVSYWVRSEDSSLILAPDLRISLGRADLVGTYRFYRAASGAEITRSHFVDGAVTLPTGGGTYLRFMASSQWGGRLSSTSLSASLWKGF